MAKKKDSSMWIFALLGALLFSKKAGANGNGNGDNGNGRIIERQEASYFFENSMFENAGFNLWFLKTTVRNRTVKPPFLVNVAGDMMAFKVTVIRNGVPVEEYKKEDAIGQPNIYGGAMPSGAVVKLEVRHFNDTGDEVISDFINLQAPAG